MAEEGWVSLWLGRAESREALENAMTVDYSEGGDFLGSEFSRCYALDHYDDDFREAEVLEVETTSVIEALDGFSAHEAVGPAFVERFGPELSTPCNAVVLLYGFRYQGSVPKLDRPGLSLRFMGAVRAVGGTR